jgi:peptidoglycan/LPS O-acetylase OafA/YrhL
MLFIAAIRSRSWWPFSWLSWRPAPLFGVLPYSHGLAHFPVIIGSHGALHAALRFVRGLVACANSAALAWLMHITVKRPCARLRQRLHRDSLPRIGDNAAASVAGSQ